MDSPCKVLGTYINPAPPDFCKNLARKDILVKKKDLFLQDYDIKSEHFKTPLNLGGNWFWIFYLCSSTF
jgi:hypothetical protein